MAVAWCLLLVKNWYLLALNHECSKMKSDPKIQVWGMSWTTNMDTLKIKFPKRYFISVLPCKVNFSPFTTVKPALIMWSFSGRYWPLFFHVSSFRMLEVEPVSKSIDTRVWLTRPERTPWPLNTYKFSSLHPLSSHELWVLELFMGTGWPSAVPSVHFPMYWGNLEHNGRYSDNDNI